MDAIRQYILSVICVVIICGMIQVLFTGSNNSLIKLITGLVVTITVIAPLIEPGNLSFGDYFDQISVDGEWAVKEGERAALQTASVFIKEKSETYILDKAAELGMDIGVEIHLREDAPQIPTEIIVKGAASPYTKKQLVDCIRQDLGIPEENQIWIS